MIVQLYTCSKWYAERAAVQRRARGPETLRADESPLPVSGLLLVKGLFR